MGDHSGHRQRVFERLFQNGIETFSELDVLELLLFFSKPRVDTRDTAAELLHEFGSLRGVLTAPRDALKKIDGIGEATVNFLACVPEISRRYFYETANGLIINTPEEAGDFLRPRFLGQTIEIAAVLCLDLKNKFICLRQIRAEKREVPSEDVDRLFTSAVECGASRVIIAHNHPSGVALPSKEDIAATLELDKKFTSCGITLIDHLIFADDDFVSLRSSGVIK